MTANNWRYPTEAEMRAARARREAEERSERWAWRVFFALAIAAFATAIGGMQLAR